MKDFYVFAFTAAFNPTLAGIGQDEAMRRSFAFQVSDNYFALLGATHGTRFRQAGALGNAVRNVVHRVVAGHVLLLQEEGGVGFTLGEDCHQHVRTGHFLAAGRLHMDHGALDDTLETGGGLRLRCSIGNKVRKLGVDVVSQIVAQFLDVHAARLHHGHGILVFGQREKQMFQRRELLAAFCGERKGAVQGFFE